MENIETYAELADLATIKRTMEALEKNGIHAFLVSTKEEARTKAFDLIPHHEEIMNMTSTTLAEIGMDEEINENLDFVSIRRMLMQDGLSPIEKKRLGTAHEWCIGSVHAVTESGQAVIASATGSQLPSYAYGAANVIWIVGTQKIVKDLNEAFDRIYRYVFPLENARAMEAYGMGSGVNKMLILNKEAIPGRIHLIFVQERLGY